MGLACRRIQRAGLAPHIFHGQKAHACKAYVTDNKDNIALTALAALQKFPTYTLRLTINSDGKTKACGTRNIPTAQSQIIARSKRRHAAEHALKIAARHVFGQHEPQAKSQWFRTHSSNVAHIHSQSLMPNLRGTEITPPKMHVLKEKVGADANFARRCHDRAIIAAPKRHGLVLVREKRMNTDEYLILTLEKARFQ